MANQQPPVSEVETNEVPIVQDEVMENQLVMPEELEQIKAKLDQFGRSYATGRRKSSVARVWLIAGEGKFTVNKKAIAEYFPRQFWINHIKQPMTVASDQQFDVIATVCGGGKSGQAGAVRYGVSRALVNYLPSLRPALRNAGYLTRDAREVERKKYGLKKARRRFQFSKR